ncbi:MAG: hypothetical protein ACRD0M_10270, partial [Acidimicrobiales bacterium]
MRASSRSGKDWLRDFVASASPPVRGESSVNDPALLLRIMADGWDLAFASELGRSDRNLVFE